MTQPAPAPEQADPPSWLDILIAAAVAGGFGVWAANSYETGGLQAALGIACVAAWVAVFAALRFNTRRRILAGREASAHAANLERAHSFVGAMLFTYLGVIAAKDAHWLTAVGFIGAAMVFGLGGARAKAP